MKSPQARAKSTSSPRRRLGAEVSELEERFHVWLTEVAPEMKALTGQTRLDAFHLKMLFVIAKELEGIKKALTSARSAEAVPPAKPVSRKRKPRQRP